LPNICPRAVSSLSPEYKCLIIRAQFLRSEKDNEQELVLDRDSKEVISFDMLLLRAVTIM
jgi:hypothetical protein